MVVIGAGGFAKEILEVLYHLKVNNISFYDDINSNLPKYVYNKYKILKNPKELSSYFEEYGNEYTLGLGNPQLRYKMFDLVNKHGGKLTSVVSQNAKIGSFDVNIGEGCVILSNVVLSNSVNIGRGSMFYYNTVITHDCNIGDFVEMSPNVTLLGRCTIKSFTHLGAGTIVLPDVTIGSNVIVGAGSVVTKDIPDNCEVLGIPAKIKKERSHFNFNHSIK